MTNVTRGLGAALIAVGVVAYLATGTDSPTALIPAVLGLIILVLGILAGRPAMHQHAIHAALVVALLGLFGTLMNVAELPALLGGRDVERPAAVVASTITFLLCAVYIALGIRSFVAARKARESSEAAASTSG